MATISLQAVSGMPALKLKHALPAGPVYYADEHHGGETQKRIDEEVTKLLKGAYSRVETLLVGCEFCFVLDHLPDNGGSTPGQALYWQAPQQHVGVQAALSRQLPDLHEPPLCSRGKPKPGQAALWPPVLQAHDTAMGPL